MQSIRFFSVVLMCWTGLAAAGSDIPMTAKQSQALGIETMPLPRAAGAAGNGLPAQVVVPNQQIRIVSAPLAGMIESMAVAVNQPVKKGQMLARLQSPALAELQRDFLLTALQAQLAQSTVDRDEQLFKDGIIAQSRYLAARNHAATQAAAASEKRHALRLAGMSDAAVSKLQASGAVDSALSLPAPIDGVVLEQMVAPGQRVDAAAPLFKLARLAPLWLEIQLPLAQAEGLQAGAAVQVPAAPARGRIISIGRSVAEATQTILVRAEITEGAEHLRPGQYAEAMIGSAPGATQWSLPNSALLRAEHQTYVFVQTSAGYRAQPVKLLGQTAAAATIAGELRGDERIVVKGAAAVKAAWQGIGKGGE